MAFTDPAPGGTAGGQAKQLYVAYLHGGTVREVVVDDLAGLVLPATAGPGEGGANGHATPSPSSSSFNGQAAASAAPRSPQPPPGIRRPFRPMPAAAASASATASGGQPGGSGSGAATGATAEEPHPAVMDVGRREWLLRQGAECLGLELPVLMERVREAAAAAV